MRPSYTCKAIPACVLLMAAGTSAPAADFPVASASDIANAMASAQPGDTLTMQDGVWTNEHIEFEGFGASGNPITLRAQTPGHVHLNGTSTLEIGGAFLVVEGLRFEGGALGSSDHVVRFRTASNFTASQCTLRDCAIIDYNPPSTSTRYFWVSLHGTGNTIENCLFENQNHSGVVVTVWDTFPNNHVIRNNHFLDMPEDPAQANGWETIRIGDSSNINLSSQTVVEGNLFERCDGEIEIISNKCGENIFRHNTFLECKGTLTLRHGFDADVYGNFFLGLDRQGSGGIRVIGPGHRIWNNYFERLDDRDGATISLYAGELNGANSGYQVMTNVILANNTIVDCDGPAFHLARGLGSSNRTEIPEDTTIIGTLISNPSENAATASNSNIDWFDNVGYISSLGTASGSGFTLTGTDPLQTGADGLQRVVPGGAAENAVSPLEPYVIDDMDGQSRSTPAEAGADELSGDPVLFFPVTSDDVGPSWWPLGGPDPDPEPGLVVEAENATEILDPDSDSSVWLIVADAGASGEAVLKSPPGSTTSLPGHETIAVYQVAFPEAGSFTAYYKARGDSTGSDSFYTPTGFAIDPDVQETTSSNGAWRWETGDQFSVPSAGTYEFRIGRREKDTEIDVFLFDLDGNLTPAELDALVEAANEPPCVGDIDASGENDFFDTAAFLNLVALMDPSADVNDDMVVDRFDVIQHLQEAAIPCE